MRFQAKCLCPIVNSYSTLLYHVLKPYIIHYVINLYLPRLINVLLLYILKLYFVLSLIEEERFLRANDRPFNLSYQYAVSESAEIDNM